MTTLQTRFDPRSRYAPDRDRVLLTGIQALVRLPLDQHRLDRARGLRTATFISGYEGSPLGGYDLQLLREAELLAAHDVRFVPGVNEELAATAVWGTQTVPRRRDDLDGIVGIWYGKAPGVDRAGDAMRHGNYAGTHPHGGVLVLAGDDPGCKSSTLPSASEGTLADRGIPVLAPADVQDVLDFGLYGIALSRYTGLWVGLKIATDIADGFEDVVTPQAPPTRVLPEEVDGRPWVPTPPPLLMNPAQAVAHEAAVFGARHRATLAFLRANPVDRLVVDPPRARLGIVAAGKTYHDVRTALRLLGFDDDALTAAGVRLLRLGAVWPVEPGMLRRFATGLEEILVVEEKRPFLERQVRELCYPLEERPAITGATDLEGRPLVPVDGELTPDRVAAPIAARIAARVPAARPRERALLASPAAPPADLPVRRVPFFCSGCPHNRSTIAPDGALVGAGIGCHAMVVFTDDPRRQAVSITQMGAEGAQWIGQAPFSAEDHFFQNLGDGTYFHSGSLAIRACVAAGVNITFKLLVNSAVAMTGGQDPSGARPVPDVVRSLLAEGVRRVIVCADDPDKYPADTSWPEGVTVWGRERVAEAQALLGETPGVTVLVYDQQCAAEARRERRRGIQPRPRTRVVIDELVCEGCGHCGLVSNCLSVRPVETELGRKTRIDQSSCNVDLTCLEGDCPAFVTVEVDPEATSARPIPPPPLDGVPEPRRPVLDGGYAVQLLGIGGTGVLTVDAILGTAAFLDGLGVKGLDQTGLSQKAGPVVSHLQFFPAGAPKAAPRIPGGGCDLYLAFDPLVAVDARFLASASPERTAAVVSTSEVPTGAMITHPDLRLPGVDLVRDRIEAVTRPGSTRYVDAVRLTETLFGSAAAANVLLAGVAYQEGLLPVSAEAIETAIRANGVAVPMNLAAFGWGRVAAARPDEVWSLASPPAPAIPVAERPALPPRLEAALAALELPPDLERVVAVRTAELLRYQDASLAGEYLEFLGRVARAESAVGDGHRLTEAVARNLFRLTAYKDEYEVARLLLDERFTRALAAEVPGARRLRYHLHPPLLRSLGVRRKLRLGTWVRPGLRLLYALRRLRGTPLDPFGHTRIRREERRLLAEYRTAMDREIERLTAETLRRAVAIAELPDMVRGFEEIKLAAIDRYRAALAELQEAAPVEAG